MDTRAASRALLSQCGGRAERSIALKWFNEHEMGELFKVIGFYKGEPCQVLGFA